MTSIENVGVSTRPCRVKSLSQPYLSVKQNPREEPSSSFVRPWQRSYLFPEPGKCYVPIFAPTERSISSDKRCRHPIIPFQGSLVNRLFQPPKSNTLNCALTVAF